MPSETSDTCRFPQAPARAVGSCRRAPTWGCAGRDAVPAPHHRHGRTSTDGSGVDPRGWGLPRGGVLLHIAEGRGGEGRGGGRGWGRGHPVQEVRRSERRAARHVSGRVRGRGAGRHGDGIDTSAWSQPCGQLPLMNRHPAVMGFDDLLLARRGKRGTDVARHQICAVWPGSTCRCFQCSEPRAALGMGVCHEGEWSRRSLAPMYRMCI